MITYERVKEVLNYNQKSGIITWRKKTGTKANRIIIGSEAGSLTNSGYRYIKIDGVHHHGHNLIWLYMEGYLPEGDVDHINRIRDDNRWCNLRHVSKQCNIRNRDKFKNNTSGVTGVCWFPPRKTWRVRIAVNGEQIYMGYFHDFTLAIKARWEAEVKYGFPNCNSTSSAFLYLKEKGLINDNKI